MKSKKMMLGTNMIIKHKKRFCATLLLIVAIMLISTYYLYSTIKIDTPCPSRGSLEFKIENFTNPFEGENDNQTLNGGGWIIRISKVAGYDDYHWDEITIKIRDASGETASLEGAIPLNSKINGIDEGVKKPLNDTNWPFFKRCELWLLQSQQTDNENINYINGTYNEKASYLENNPPHGDEFITTENAQFILFDTYRIYYSTGEKISIEDKNIVGAGDYIILFKDNDRDGINEFNEVHIQIMWKKNCIIGNTHIS